MSTATQEPASSASGPADARLTAEDEAALTSLFADWETLARQKDILPPMSPLTSQLLSLDLNDPQATALLTRIIETDPVLTARILGLANSAALARAGKPVCDVMAAVMRLGADPTFEAVFTQLAALWLRDASKLPDQAQLHELWLEYLIAAFCARELATAVGDVEIKPSVAYAAGLLHDVGTLALCFADPGPMSRLLRSGYAIGTPLYERFVDAHTNLGAALLQRWRTPQQLVAVAARHHAGFAPEESALTGIVFLADHLHQKILDHERGSFERTVTAPLGCFGGATHETRAALLGLGLTERLDEIVARVASESQRIETLAAAVPG